MSYFNPPKYDANGMMIFEVYALEPGEEVGCYYCMKGGNSNRYETYKRGEAFLCGPECPPYNAEANYICMDHLPDPHEIVDLYEKRRATDRRDA